MVKWFTMNFRDYFLRLSGAEKRRLAEKLNTSTAYLHHLSTGYRNAGAKFLLNIEDATNGAVTPREMRND